MNALLKSAINGKPPPPRMIHVIGHNTLNTYFEK